MNSGDRNRWKKPAAGLLMAVLWVGAAQPGQAWIFDWKPAGGNNGNNPHPQVPPTPPDPMAPPNGPGDNPPPPTNVVPPDPYLPPPPLEETPEPATIIAALIGAGLLGSLYSRKKKR